MMTNLSELRNFLCNKGEYERGVGREIVNPPARILSEVCESPYTLYRSCVLHVPDKFLAQTVVIFPRFGVNTPIFGCEYIQTPSRCFGAVDFHPQGGDFSLTYGVLADCPDREIEKSKHYDLDEYFSPKLWLKKSSDPLYDEFVHVSKDRIQRYHSMLRGVSPVPAPSPVGYCQYMSQHDPARGILRVYFGTSFANDYIDGFLFPTNCNYSGVVRDLQGFSLIGYK
jgi:hypothetical protein